MRCAGPRVHRSGAHGRRRTPRGGRSRPRTLQRAVDAVHRAPGARAVLPVSQPRPFIVHDRSCVGADGHSIAIRSAAGAPSSRGGSPRARRPLACVRAGVPVALEGSTTTNASSSPNTVATTPSICDETSASNPSRVSGTCRGQPDPEQTRRGRDTEGGGGRAEEGVAPARSRLSLALSSARCMNAPAESAAPRGRMRRQAPSRRASTRRRCPCRGRRRCRHLLLEARVLDRHEHLDTAIEVAGHQVGAPDPRPTLVRRPRTSRCGCARGSGRARSAR